jgi:hypothetical protein
VPDAEPSQHGFEKPAADDAFPGSSGINGIAAEAA